MGAKEVFSGSKQRLITGLCLLGVALFVVFVNIPFITWVALGVIAFFTFSEMYTILKLDDNKLYIYAIIVWIVAYFYPNPEILIAFLAVFMLGFMAYKGNVNYKILFPFLYPLAPMIFILSIPQSFGIGTLVWFVFIVGITDTAAYFGGKSIGTTPFSPTSPKKTWEGCFAGLLGGTFFGVIAGLFITSFWIALIVSFLTAIASILGDLFESYIKRQANIKDSGNILPGHGGMLDRADGYLFAAIIMVVILRGLI